MTRYDGPIVITGMGTVSPFGLGVEATWSALKRGDRQGMMLEPAEPNGASVLSLKVGEWQPANLLGKRGLQYLRPGTQFLLGASTLAMREAELANGEAHPDELGIVIGSNLTGLPSITNYDYTAIKEGPQYNSPMEAPNVLANAPASHLAIRLQARALNTTIATGQCTGLDALGYANTALRAGRAKYLCVGGVEELSPSALWIYHQANVLPTERREDAGYPFDVESSGWLPGEGAAVVVLERKSDALARGVRPLAELAGWSSAFAPSQDIEKRSLTLSKTARQALRAANISPEKVDVIIAGANGLRMQDQAEALALRDLLSYNRKTFVTAIKGTLGETYGASGLFQALTAICAIDSGVIPRTMGKALQQLIDPPVKGLLTETSAWPGSKHGVALLLAQDLFGSTSAIVLRGSQE